MTWYLTNIPRFRNERAGVQALALENVGVVPLQWRMGDKARLVLDVDFLVGNRTFEGFLQYPAQFPDIPPSVYPRDQKSRWSGHQYGPGGELCLEYRPDNWTSDLTGVDILRSAHRLLSTENTVESDAGYVPSAHEESLGQSLRADYFRFLLTRSLDQFFAGIEIGQRLKCNVLTHFRNASAIYIVDKVTKADGEVWKNPDVPEGLDAEAFEREISVIRIPDEMSLPSTSDVAEFRGGMAAIGFDAADRRVLILRGTQPYGFLVSDKSVTPMAVVPPEDEVARLDAGHSALRNKSVALVGCGSLGSKIATSLARAGVGYFFLVDDDVLLPGNLVRNDLDWRDVGVHKARAVEQRLRNVNPGVVVYARCFRFAGQEASESAETALAALLSCDIVIDATADPNVFNLLSSVVEKKKKPMVWGEVFGGGFGGLIARYRPSVEPPPVFMRRVVENWFGEKGYVPKRPGRRYDTGGDGPPMIADDADVMSIAAATTRLAIDLLIGREPSYFPSSVYVMGLASEPGLFTQAFDTFPIEMPPPPTPAPAEELSPEETQAVAEEIIKLISAT